MCGRRRGDSRALCPARGRRDERPNGKHNTRTPGNHRRTNPPDEARKPQSRNDRSRNANPRRRKAGPSRRPTADRTRNPPTNPEPGTKPARGNPRPPRRNHRPEERESQNGTHGGTQSRTNPEPETAKAIIQHQDQLLFAFGGLMRSQGRRFAPFISTLDPHDTMRKHGSVPRGDICGQSVPSELGFSVLSLHSPVARIRARSGRGSDRRSDRSSRSGKPRCGRGSGRPRGARIRSSVNISVSWRCSFPLLDI